MQYQFNFGALLPYWDVLLKGCFLTLMLTICSISIGLGLGIVTVVMRRSSHSGLRYIAASYVEFVRNTPFLVQVMFIFFALPSLGLSLDPWTAAIVALSLNCGAYAAEIIRGGVDAIPVGQFEAGAALGLAPLQVFRFIVLKPALRIIFPALSGQFILILLNTSIVSTISAEELTSAAQMIDTTLFRSFEIYIVAASLYLAMAIIFSTCFKWLSRHYFSYPTT